MNFHVVTGLPRSGSTLLCNILNQNPAFHASSTSVLPQTLATLSGLWSNSPEIKSDLINDRDRTNERMLRGMRALVEEWYADQGDKLVFDKGRGWALNALLLKQLYPESRILVTVRDLRAVFGSVEKQHRANPILDHAGTILQKALYTRADQMFSAEGLIGGPIAGVEDLVRRQLPGVMIVQYEALSKNPGFVLDKVYAELGCEPFEHDFNNVEATSTDVDALYLDKFEHRGNGKVEPAETSDWQKFVSPDLGTTIMQRFPFYNKAFSYTL